MRPARRWRTASPLRRRILWSIAFVLVFAIGIALGEALEDNPRRGQTVTRDRTFTLQPESATVTVTAP